jgi:Contractile injection system tape measure protein
MRLIYQAPHEVLEKIALILGAPEGEMLTWIAELPLLSGLAVDIFMPGHLVRIAFWEAVLTALLPPGPVALTGQDFIASFLRTLARVSGHPPNELVRVFQHGLRELSSETEKEIVRASRLVRMLQLTLRNLSLSDSHVPAFRDRFSAGPSTGDQQGKISRGAFSSGEDMVGFAEAQAVVQQGGSDASSIVACGDAENLPMAQGGESTGQEVESRYFVENAGLVIFWPYLGSFFSRCGLLREGAFTDELTAMQAITLLQYLVNGDQKPGEPHLTLNKVLCGWPLNRPLCRFLPLPEGAEEESERLLRSVIDHWSILRNTSPQGLRESFLQRGGVLCDESASWVLQMERRSYDMLLDYLPWGITMVQLSWMTKPLIVQW